MKMFKKLMAVALTAVMAVSMLTGCSFSETAKQNALVKALNNENTQTAYKYSSANYESTGKKIWQNELDEGKKIVAADRKSTRLNSSHSGQSRMPSSA